jgi:hypothetical protein
VPAKRAASLKTWTPPTADDWSGMLRSATLARDLLHGPDAELRASGIAADTATVEHLSDVFSDVLDELEAAANVVAEAERRLLVEAAAPT